MLIFHHPPDQLLERRGAVPAVEGLLQRLEDVDREGAAAAARRSAGRLIVPVVVVVILAKKFLDKLETENFTCTVVQYVRAWWERESLRPRSRSTEPLLLPPRTRERTSPRDRCRSRSGVGLPTTTAPG